MPLYAYECHVCHFKDDYIDKINDFPQHFCPKCAVECKKWIKIDLATDEMESSVGQIVKEWEEGQEGFTQGEKVLLTRVITAPHIVQKGYLPTDARYSRGRG